MARIFLLLIWVSILLGCKKDDYSPVPDMLVGKWRMTEWEVPVNNSSVWEVTPATSPVFMGFNANGEVVNDAGERRVCGPSKLNINGKPYKIKLESPVEVSQYLALCADCPTWNITLNGDEILVEKCSSDYRMKFVKE